MGWTRVTDPLKDPLRAQTCYRTHYPSQTRPHSLLLAAPPAGGIPAVPRAKVLRPSHRSLPRHILSLPATDCGPSHPLLLLHAIAPLLHAAARRCCFRRQEPRVAPSPAASPAGRCQAELSPRVAAAITACLRCRCRARSRCDAMDKVLRDKSWVASPLLASWCVCGRRLGRGVASPFTRLGSMHWHTRACCVATLLHPPIQLASPTTHEQMFCLPLTLTWVNVLLVYACSSL
jgi:hypothetical protein